MAFTYEGLQFVTEQLKFFIRKIICDFSNMPATVSDKVDSALYHLIQEALVNSFRHGEATEVRVGFWYDDARIDLRVEDNGCGAPRIVEGIGLRGMRERIEALGGAIRVESSPLGFAVMASVPVQVANADQAADIRGTA